MITPAVLMIKVAADTTAAETGLGRVSGMLGSGGGLAVAAGAAALAVVAVGVAATKMAGDFQSGTETLVTGAGEAQSNLSMVRDGMLKMATDTGTSTKQLTDGMFMIESAGYRGADALKVLQAAAEGAKVGQADLGTVADATTTIMKDYPNVMNGANGAVNTLIATVSNGKTHMEDLAGSLSQILPTASSAHVGLNDVMGAMATMTGEGVPAANAATYLRQTILALDAPSDQAKAALEAVGLSSTQVSDEMQKSLPDALKMITDAVGKKFPAGSAEYVQAIKEISGGSKTMQGMLDLTGQHMSDFQSNVAAVNDQVKKGGNSIVGWSQVQDIFNFKVDRAKEVVGTLMIRLGTGLLPVAGQIVDFFANNLLPTVDNLVVGISNTINVITNVVSWLYQGRGAIEAVGGVIATIFLPLIIKTGIESAIAGAKMAAEFIANIVKSGVEMAVAAGKAAIYSMSLVLSGTDAVVAGGKITISFVASLIRSGAESVVAGAKIVGSFVASLVTTGIQAAKTAVVMTAQMIPALVASGIQFVQMAVTSIASTIAAFIAYIPVALSAAAATIAATWPFLLVAAAIAGVIAIIILLVTHWTQVTDFLGTVWKDVSNGVLAGIGFLTNGIHGLGDAVCLIPGWFGAAFGSIVGIVKPPINWLIGGIDTLIKGMDAIHFNVPSWVPDAGGKGFAINIPMIPLLAEGGQITQSGYAVVGDAGPELLKLPAGAEVAPLRTSIPAGMSQANGLASATANGQPVQFNLYFDGHKLASLVTQLQPGIVRSATGTRSF